MKGTHAKLVALAALATFSTNASAQTKTVGAVDDTLFRHRRVGRRLLRRLQQLPAGDDEVVHHQRCGVLTRSEWTVTSTQADG
jgi:hypothetical protein